MVKFDRKTHWENIYQTKELKDMSWYQASPDIALDFLKQFNIPLTSKIIDVGGGDSLLIDNLLDIGYQNVTILDISETALDRAKKRLGERAGVVNWIVADIATYRPTEKYDLWYDRATFHFLTERKEITSYINTVYQSLNETGIMVIGAFSEDGPKKCSGIEITQYSEQTMTNRMKELFEKIQCKTIDHYTPFNIVQNFIFCSFLKLQPA